MAEAYDVTVIGSTSGAVDSSITGFLAGFLNGNIVEETVKIANAVATQSIMAYDVFSQVKNFGSTLEMVKRGMPVIHQQIENTIIA